MNAVQLLGNLGRDPIIRATKTDRAAGVRVSTGEQEQHTRPVKQNTMRR